MKILVGDDDILGIRSCTRILEAEGFVSEAQEEIEIMPKEFFDMMLVDVEMPAHDGLFLMKEIRKNFPDIPMGVMSGCPMPETIADACRSGANLLYRNRSGPKLDLTPGTGVGRSVAFHGRETSWLRKC